MKAAQGKPVFWINDLAPNKPWIAPNNVQLVQEAKKYKNLKIINWNAAARGKKNWFWSDNIHPKGVGADHYAALIANSLTDLKK